MGKGDIQIQVVLNLPSAVFTLEMDTCEFTWNLQENIPREPTLKMVVRSLGDLAKPLTPM